jgi:hypothetical protein
MFFNFKQLIKALLSIVWWLINTIALEAVHQVFLDGFELEVQLSHEVLNVVIHGQDVAMDHHLHIA